MKWRTLDLFSGIGGFSLAAQWVWGDELEIVAFCEIDPFCQKVLKKHWPNVPIIEDVRDVTKEIISNHASNLRRTSGHERYNPLDGSHFIDLLTGGFPCQPFSVAGKRKGKEDDRFLWPEMFRVIKEIRPRWVIAENVAGIVRMALDDCLSDLESEGYSTQAVILPACAVNAPHRRDRVWIVAHAKQSCRGGRIFERLSDGGRGISTKESKSLQFKNRETYPSDIEQGSQDVADSDKFNGNGARFHSSKLSQFKETRISKECRSTQSRLGRMVDGIPDWSHEPESVPRVARGVKERVNRLKSLGNAIVPRVAYQIMMAIKGYWDEN